MPRSRASGIANKRFYFGPLEILGAPYDSKMLRYAPADKEYSLIPKTRTVLASYDAVDYQGATYTDVKLALIHEHDPDALRAECENIGFKVVYEGDHRSAAALLLQK